MSFLSDKIGPELGMALQLPEDLRQKSISMSLGYDTLNRTWEAVVKYHGNLERITGEQDITAEILTERYAIVTFKADKIIPLLSYQEIEYMEKPKPVSMLLDNSLSRSCILAVQNNPPYQLTGKGTIVGIIDSGVDYAHPDFIGEDGTSRILYIWDQTIEGHPPDGFRFGTEYTNEMINEALKIKDINERMNFLPHSDFSHHGTHVTGIAAGNGRVSGGRLKGIAPEASLIVVKLGTVSRTSLTKTTEIMRALKYITERAERLKMPVAINLSYGTSEGANDGSSLFDTYTDDISLRWKSVICAATGNEGSAGHHRSGVLSNNCLEEIEFVVSGGLNSLTLEIWKSYVDKFDIEIVSPGGESTGRISFKSINQHFTFERSIVYIEFVQATPFSGNECVLIALFPVDRQLTEGIWIMRLYPVSVVTGQYDIWLPTTEVTGYDTYFLRPSAQNTATSPSTASRVISVGGYDHRSGRISYFSGRGTVPYHNIPDLVAPAENIMSAIPGSGYDALTGTSMAAPHVAGSVALLMQWGIVRENDPYLYGQKIKACLKFGAGRNLNISYPNAEWGYGQLCLLDTFKYLI